MQDGTRDESLSRPEPITVGYVVRAGDINEELRYSLRSLSNLPVNRVIIAGYRPEWVTNVDYLPTHPTDRYRSAERNLIRICRNVDQFALFNDDFFCLRPQKSIPVWHRGTLLLMRERHPGSRGSKWWRGINEAATQLEVWGYTMPLSYELHVPLLIQSDIMLEVLARARAETHRPALMKRSLYGNVAGIGGTQHCDVKLRHPNAALNRTMMWVSSNDVTFGRSVFGRQIRERFPTPSPWEKQ